DLEDGPGKRTNSAVAYSIKDGGTLHVYGGMDQSEVFHNDLWEYRIQTRQWTQSMPDCNDVGCPPLAGSNVLLSRLDGNLLTVYTNDPNDTLTRPAQ
ncbi:MAG: hypothetical protein GY854_05375, partial [Deltaproteobacteria bacterium]|nr:hypothetical protein [Deltaproteobacteria bacterium]